jgi:hypothetical protein
MKMRDWMVWLVMPLVLIFSGRHFRTKSQDKIGAWFGHKTPRSTMNIDTWRFAQAYSSKLSLIIGPVVLAITVVLIFLLESDDNVGATILIILVQLGIVLIQKIITEKALKKNFDEKGNRINGEEKIDV